MKDWNGYIRREDLENESGEVDMDKVRALSLNTYLRYIGDYAFEGCSELTNVLLWGRSTKIGKDAFANCPKLENVPH